MFKVEFPAKIGDYTAITTRTLGKACKVIKWVRF
jgi:hypothetical protein